VRWDVDISDQPIEAVMSERVARVWPDALPGTDGNPLFAAHRERAMPVVNGNAGTRWVRRILVVSLFAAAGAWAQPEAFPVVTPVEQAQRDSLRLHVLQTELAAEEAGLAEAAKRKAERTAAGDHPGAREAGEAVQAHQRNVSALRVEIDKVAASHTSVDGAPGTDQGTHRGGLRHAEQPRPAARAGGHRREALWWDAYGNPERGEVARPGASGDPAPQAPVWWSAYPGARTP